VAVSVLQLDEVSLYAAGLALIEQNLHMLDSMNLFENQARKLATCSWEFCVGVEALKSCGIIVVVPWKPDRQMYHGLEI